MMGLIFAGVLSCIGAIESAAAELVRFQAARGALVACLEAQGRPTEAAQIRNLPVPTTAFGLVRAAVNLENERRAECRERPATPPSEPEQAVAVAEPQDDPDEVADAASRLPPIGLGAGGGAGGLPTFPAAPSTVAFLDSTPPGFSGAATALAVVNEADPQGSGVCDLLGLEIAGRPVVVTSASRPVVGEIMNGGGFVSGIPFGRGVQLFRPLLPPGERDYRVTAICYQRAGPLYLRPQGQPTVANGVPAIVAARGPIVETSRNTLVFYTGVPRYEITRFGVGL